MAVATPSASGGNSAPSRRCPFKGERGQLQLQRGTNIDLIQTDARHQPRHSGGPLLNTPAR